MAPSSQRSEAAQAAAVSADSLGVGVEEEQQVTSLSELGSQAVDALNLYIDSQDPPTAAAGAGSDSSKRGSAASEADSGPTLFPMFVFTIEDRGIEPEEPFAGPDVDWEEPDAPGEGTAASSAVPVDPAIETTNQAAATAQGQPTPVVQPSLDNTPPTDSTDQGPPAPEEEEVSTSMNSPNPVEQDQPIPAEEEPEEFVPPERLIAQASSTPHSPPIPTNNFLFDPLGDDDESTVEDDESEEIARRIQEQYDLEAALEASAAEAGVEPEPANVESEGPQPGSGGGEAAASGAGQGERDRARRRGCKAGAKHVSGRENRAYGTTCEYIGAQLGNSTYARFGRQFNLPHIPPHIARKQYPEWFGYVLRHSDRWAFDTDGELLPVDTILRWATILPELWQFCTPSIPRYCRACRNPISATQRILDIGSSLRSPSPCAIGRNQGCSTPNGV